MSLELQDLAQNPFENSSQCPPEHSSLYPERLTGDSMAKLRWGQYLRWEPVTPEKSLGVLIDGSIKTSS